MIADQCPRKQFDNEKQQVLNRKDLSIKGSIDEPIESLVNQINYCSDLYTTSSCSGRIAFISGVVPVTSNSSDTGIDISAKKKNALSQFVFHDQIDNADRIIESILQSNCQFLNLTFKFEPFILHIRCRTLELARNLLHCSIDSGNKNSGLIISNSGHFTVAVRNTLNLEVPIIVNGEVVVDKKYLHILISIANEKMKRNFEMIKKFETYCKTKQLF